MNIVYCDDDEAYLNKIMNDYDGHIGSSSLSVCVSPYELLKTAESGNIDIVMLDIDFNTPEINGLDVCRMLLERCPKIQIVIVTSYTEKYIEDVFLTKANIRGFIKKPIEEASLYAMIEKAKKYIVSNSKQVMLKMRSGYTLLDENDIIYIESMGRIAHIHTVSGIVDVYMKLGELRCMLSSVCTNCHKSFIVNIKYIKSVENKLVMLSDGSFIPLSRSYSAALKEAIEEYRISCITEKFIN